MFKNSLKEGGDNEITDRWVLYLDLSRGENSCPFGVYAGVCCKFGLPGGLGIEKEQDGNTGPFRSGSFMPGL